MSMLLTTIRGRLDLMSDTRTHELVDDIAQRLNTDIDEVCSLITGLSGQQT